MDALESGFQESATPIITRMKDDAIGRLETMLADGDVRSLQGFGLKYTKDYSILVAQTMRQAYEYAKKATAEELKAEAPPTSRDAIALITQQAAASTDKQMQDLVFAIKAVVISSMRKKQLSTNLGLTDVIASVSAIFAAFTQNKTATTAAVAVSMGVNLGRRDVFTSNKSDIAAYQYSAILDSVTCPICLSLDGSVVDYAGYMDTAWNPPVHINCRCIWVAVMADQSEIPDFTGMPESPGGKESPDL